MRRFRSVGRIARKDHAQPATLLRFQQRVFWRQGGPRIGPFKPARKPAVYLAADNIVSDSPTAGTSNRARTRPIRSRVRLTRRAFDLRQCASDELCSLKRACAGNGPNLASGRASLRAATRRHRCVPCLRQRHLGPASSSTGSSASPPDQARTSISSPAAGGEKAGPGTMSTTIRSAASWTTWYCPTQPSSCSRMMISYGCTRRPLGSRKKSSMRPWTWPIVPNGLPQAHPPDAPRVATSPRR